MAHSTGSGAEQASALRRLVVGCLSPTSQDDPARILELIATAVESLVPCQVIGIKLDRTWQNVGQRGRGIAPASAAAMPGGRQGEPVEVAGVSCAWAYQLPGIDGGLLVVGGPAQLAEDDRQLVLALAQQGGAALAAARLHARERAQLAELRAANLALSRGAEIHDRLTQVALRGEGDEGIARAVYALTGHPAEVEDSYGNLMARAGPWPPAPHPRTPPAGRADLLRRAAAAHGPVREGDRLVSVAVLAGTPVGVIALADPDNCAGETERTAVEHAAAVMAMDAARAASLHESRARARSNLVLDLITGQDGSRVLGRAQALSYDLSRPHRVVAVECRPHGAAEIGVFLQAVTRAAMASRIGSLLAARMTDVIVLADTDAPWDQFQSGVVAELNGARCAVGVGGRCEKVAEFPRSYRESQLALRIQRAVGVTEQVTVFEELGVYQVLATETDMSAMEAFVRDWLGALLDYDAVHGAQLVTTLSEYLDSGGSYDSSATALSVHRSTLKYRLRRIRDVSGYDLSVPDTQFNLQLATRAWRTLQALRQS
jgi:sugar diacid utilization regulator